MVKTQNIPTDYHPYEFVNFCSNKLMNVSYLINDNDFIPLLIGKGEVPKVWLYSKSNTGIVPLIEKSISKHPAFSVDINLDDKSILIKLNNITNDNLLTIGYQQLNKIFVTHLDLRVIGYNITGDEKSLLVGTNKISGNTMTNLGTFIALGGN